MSGTPFIPDSDGSEYALGFHKKTARIGYFSDIVIDGGFRNGTVIRVIPAVEYGTYAGEVEPFAFSDFPYYFGSPNSNPKPYKSVKSIVSAVQSYLNRYGDGGVATLIMR